MTLADIRQKYALAVENTDEIPELENWLAIADASAGLDATAVILAYNASAQALKARTVSFPMAKLGHLNKSKELFRQAINLAPNNLEVRLLRLSVESAIPAWLSLSGNMSSDKDLLLNNLDTLFISDVDSTLLKKLLGYLIHKNVFDATQTLLITEKLSAIQ